MRPNQVAINHKPLLALFAHFATEFFAQIKRRNKFDSHLDLLFFLSRKLATVKEKQLQQVLLTKSVVCSLPFAGYCCRRHSSFLLLYNWMSLESRSPKRFTSEHSQFNIDL